MRPPAAVLALLAAFPSQETEPLKVDEKAGRVSFGAKVARQDVYEQLKGVVEYAIVLPKGKEYESVFIASVDPIALRDGMVKIGLKAGKPAGEGQPPAGSALRIFVEWKDAGKDRREPIEYFVLDTLARKAMAPAKWTFAGSREGFVGELERTDLLVLNNKNLVGLLHHDSTVLVQAAEKAKDEHQYKAKRDVLPKEGTAVRIVFEPAK